MFFLHFVHFRFRGPALPTVRTCSSLYSTNTLMTTVFTVLAVLVLVMRKRENNNKGKGRDNNKTREEREVNKCATGLRPGVPG